MLLVLFIGLKLTGYVAWSWWWVLSPFWIPFAVGLIVGFIAAFRAASKKKPTAAERANREGRGSTH